MEAGHHVRTALGGQAHGVFAACLKVGAVLDQVHTQCTHGSVFFNAVALRDHDGAAHPVRPCCPTDALAMVAPRGADHFTGQLPLCGQLGKVRQPATDFERTHRRVVFVLDPHLCAQALCQQGPGILRCGLEGAVHHLRGGFDLGQCGQLCQRVGVVNGDGCGVHGGDFCGVTAVGGGFNEGRLARAWSG